MITLDRRSGSYELLPYFPRGLAQLGHLEFGDASFSGNGPDGPVLIGVERKSIYDLINSIDSGRLQGHQLPGLLNSYSYVYIVVEGLWRHGPGGVLEVWSKRGWTPLQNGRRRYMTRAVHNFLNSLSVKLRVIHYRTDNSGHTASLIVDLFRWWQKEWSSHKGYMGFNVDPHPVPMTLVKPNLVQRILKELPGVGWDRSMEASKFFPSVESMINASIKDWKSIPGIGKTIAERVWRAIHEDV